MTPAIVYLLLPLYLIAQPSVDDFYGTGDVVISRDNCFQLTYPTPWSSGSVWYRDSVDLSQSFQMEFDLMLGCEDGAGADGVVFVFAPFRTGGGYRGEGLGFAGLQPSLGIEIDTWQNDHLADPIEDHVAILAHGDVMHYGNLAGPQIVPNLEDCQLHKIEIEWSSENHIIAFSIDDQLVISYEGDLVELIFGGNPIVYWGITAATGRYVNRHEVCVQRLEFGHPMARLYFDRVTQNKLARGQKLELKNLDFYREQNHWLQGSEGELFQLFNYLQRHPDQNLTIQAHDFELGDGQKRSQSRADAIRDFLVMKGIDRHRIKASGFGEQFRAIDDRSRIEIQIHRAGT